MIISCLKLFFDIYKEDKLRKITIFFVAVIICLLGWMSRQDTAEAVVVSKPTESIEIQEGQKDFPVNPYKGRIWNQYCDKIRGDDGAVIEISCSESWASEPLPGGCSAKTLNYKGYSGCSAAAMAYVINQMLSPLEIETATGKPVLGVTPNFLIDEVFPSKGYYLDCNGFSEVQMIDILSYFGLSSRTEPVSKHTLEKTILPGEMAIVGVRVNYKGEWMEHWVVPIDFVDKKIVFADSYYGEGEAIVLDEVSGIYSWDIISIMIISKTSP